MPPNVSTPLSYEAEPVPGFRNLPSFYVNANLVPVYKARQAKPSQTLLCFLRETLGLTGSKLGCAEGGCGACTVMISKFVGGSLHHYSVNACLMPVLAADGCHVTTVEGIGSVQSGKLHPVQQAMVEMHGSQCGFCTPGIIVSLYTLLTNKNTVEHIEEHLDGNLCRCTGYRPIWDAARSLCEDDDVVRGPCGTPCKECPEHSTCEQDCNLVVSTTEDKTQRYKDTLLANASSWRKQADTMFPKDWTAPTDPLWVVDDSGAAWIQPTTFEQLLEIMQEPGKIVIGNTEVGIEARFKHSTFPRLVHPSESITELFDFQVNKEDVLIGSCCPLSTIQAKCGEHLDGPLSRTLKPIHDMLRWFASTQIRNVACLGGNLVTASPISDMNPVLAAVGAELVLASMEKEGQIVRRTVKVADFFLKYRVVDLKEAEVLECIRVPILTSNLEFFCPFKQARRREDDISIVTSGQRIQLKRVDEKFVIVEASLAFGGMAPTTVMANKTAKILEGADFSRATFVSARETLQEELKLPEAVPGGQGAYRMTLASSFLYKMFLTTAGELKKEFSDVDLPGFSEVEQSGSFNFLSAPKPSFSGIQTHPTPKVAKGLEGDDPTGMGSTVSAVGEAVPHASGALHCTGEAIYADDIPTPHGTLHAALVLSTECGGLLESMDIHPALDIAGVVGVYTYEDLLLLGGDNKMGPILHDELVFLPVGEKVRTIGQVFGIVVAETLDAAELGARSVVVSYGAVVGKIVVTIDDAIEASSYYEISRHSYHRGDTTVLESLTPSDPSARPKIGDIITVSGSFRSGPQEHFYLETNASLVVPSEGNSNLTVYSSTQAPTKTQNYCASATGTQASKVVVRVKRMGGGFGGKETRSVFVSAAAAVAAKRSNRPIRLTISRDVDMKTTGTRHAFVSSYTASARITETGADLLACDLKLFANGGFAFDLSGPVVDRALFHCDGCYYYPHFRAEGVVCKTVQPAHTAFRGFGGPQGQSIAEHVIEHLSVACNTSADALRRSNMYKDGDHFPFGMVVGESDSGKWNVPKMWDRVYKKMDVAKMRSEIEDFNKKHKWIKRGLALIPTKFGIAFTSKFMNQGGALVHVYLDGTVLGTEMGQGLHTKVCQVAAQAFGIPLENVYVDDSSTDKVANTIPTAASMSTDMYGMATLDACRKISARLEPIRTRLGPDASFKDVVNAAHFDRVDLTAHGFFTVTDSRCGYDWMKEKPEGFSPEKPANSWKGHPFNYFTQGIACSVVEVDALSGSHKVLHSEVLVDVGSSINPVIDIGQIEGAFMQGAGWSTMEEVIYACDDHTWIRPRGAVFTTGPGTYKIPAFNDAPEVFNVSLMDEVDNPFAVHSSKAVGEPPFFLGTSVFSAIKDAVSSARKDNLGDSSYFEMRLPATSERIRMYCGDEIAAKAVTLVKGGEFAMANFQPQGTF